MKLLIIGAGHGGSEPGAIANGYVEKDLNIVVAKRVAELLKQYKPDLIRTDDKFVSLARRANIARGKYRYFLSVHFNAGGGVGIETIHSKFSVAGKQLATDIAQGIKETTGLPIRRVFTRSASDGKDYYAMHRNTGSTTTVIVEGLFLDSTKDIQFLNVEKIAQGIANGFIKFIEGDKKDVVTSGAYKKVSITGRTNYATLRNGSVGNDVRVLQEELARIGYYTGTIDGDFGPKTYNAVQRLQTGNGLKIDGIVGEATWRNLLIAHVYEVDPLILKNEIIKLPGDQIKGNFINSIFFDMFSMSPLGNMVNDGRVLTKQKIYNEQGKPHDYVKRGNLIVYKDGTVSVKMIMDIEKEEDISKIRFAVSGFNMNPLNLKDEWQPADVGRTTWRSMLGYNMVTGMINAVVMPNCSAERGVVILDRLGCDFKLGLDSGYSTNARFGTDIRLTDRNLYGIIRFG